ncbi:ASDURF protein [Lampetra fluviatilis]
MASDLKELSKKVREQTVLCEELAGLAAGRRVYTQQPNSDVYFLAEKPQMLSKCRKTLDDLKQQEKKQEAALASSTAEDSHKRRSFH